MQIRQARRGDIGAIARLYFETVRRVNIRDYSPAQVEAWAARVFTDDRWWRRFARRAVWVADDGGAVRGFAELTVAGEIDCFYVYHACQRQAVGARLLRRLERAARWRGVVVLEVDAGITAVPFFRRMGFQVRRRMNIHRGQRFRQHRMRKVLRPAARRQVTAGGVATPR